MELHFNLLGSSNKTKQLISFQNIAFSIFSAEINLHSFLTSSCAIKMMTKFCFAGKDIVVYTM